MKYFCVESERKGTCYHEFQKGRFETMEFWKEDSLLIHDTVYGEIGLRVLIESVIKDYDYCSNTEVTKEQWNRIYDSAIARGGELKEALLEANAWVEDTFEEYEVFTIIGL